MQVMHEYSASEDIPSPEECIEILKQFGADRQLINHCMTVAELAGEIADALNRAGHYVDMRLVLAGALLHDIAKGKKKHDLIGGLWLERMGYSSVAKVIAAHIDLPEDAIEAVDERAVVYFADKLIMGNSFVDINERFNTKLDKYKHDEQAKQAILKRIDAVRRVQERINSILFF